MNILSDFDFSKTLIDRESLQQAQNESPFMHLGVEFLKEVCTYTTVLGGVYKMDSYGNPRLWTRNEAILGGMMVKCTKLLIGYLDNICQKRMEIAFIIQRSLAETAINLCYLLKYKSDDLFDEYVEYSLRTEKKLLETIERNIQNRGCELPIESRMKKSIIKSFEESEVDPRDVDAKNKKPWGGNIYDRFNKVGLKDAYIALMDLGSHSIHGNWQELLQYHLEYKEDGLFAPRFEWECPRPQPLFAIGNVICNMLIQYLEDFLPQSQEKVFLKSAIEDLIDRIREADEMHEAFLDK